AATFTFSTPPPQVTSFFPRGGPARRDQIMFVAFDQRIDPDAVLKTITVSAGSQRFDLRMATPDEISADPSLLSYSNAESTAEPPGGFIAFRAKELLPADTAISVAIGPGTPSIEGPRTTKKAQQESFRTYAPLKITEHRCGWGEKCLPFQPFQ